MKTKNLLQTIILILVFCLQNPFANAQSCNYTHPCPAGYHCSNQVCIVNVPTCNVCRGGCGFICVKKVSCGSIQFYNNQGWHACPFRLSNGEAITEENKVSIFPNLVTSSTTISFTLSRSQKVSIKILDINGRLVTTITENVFEEGENELVWSAEEVNAGIYILQFQSAEMLQSEKIMVTK